MSKTYAEKLKDPRWQQMRLKVMQYANFRCQVCGDKKRTQHVHHSYYVKGKMPWQYPIGSLILVCEQCHGVIHPERKEVTTEESGNDKMTPKEALEMIRQARERIAGR